MARKPLRERVKDVVTLKTAKENFLSNDGFLEHWFAHGATELANMNLHGHPAPLYAGHSSPPDLQSAFGAPEQSADKGTGLDQPNQPAQEKSNILEQTMESLQRQTEMIEPEPEIEP